MRSSFRREEPCLLEPMQNVLIALQDVHNLPIHSHASVEKIQREVPCQE